MEQRTAVIKLGGWSEFGVAVSFWRSGSGSDADLMQERTMLDKDDVDKESLPVRFVWSAPGPRMRTLIQVNAWRRQINQASLPCGKL